MTTPSPRGAGASPQKQALIDAYDEALRAAAEKSAPPPPPPPSIRRFVAPVVLVLSLAFAGYLMVARPAWLLPPPPPPESPAVAEASLRMAIYATARRVELYRERTGRLPATLAEIPSTYGGVTYQVTGSQYQLEGRSGKLHLVYRSDQPAVQFVGNSYEVLVHRGEPGQ